MEALHVSWAGRQFGPKYAESSGLSDIMENGEVQDVKEDPYELAKPIKSIQVSPYSCLPPSDFFLGLEKNAVFLPEF